MRIVSLLPSVTEILFAIGAGEHVVGVTHECDFPPEARTLPVLTRSLLPAELQPQPDLDPGPSSTMSNSPGTGRAARIDRHVRASLHRGSSLYALDSAVLERLAPDLIITQELCAVCAVAYDDIAQAAKRLRGDGPAVISLEPSSLDDVYATIRTVGDAAAAASGAVALIESLRAREAALRSAAALVPRPTVVILEWTDPPMSGGHWTPGLVELAGGTAVLAHPGRNSQRITWEAIADSDPDIIIVAPCGYDLDRARGAAEELEDNPVWTGLRAVRTGHAYAMDGNAFVNRPGPRLLETAEIFARAIRDDPRPASAIVPVSRRYWAYR